VANVVAVADDDNLASHYSKLTPQVSNRLRSTRTAWAAHMTTTADRIRTVQE